MVDAFAAVVCATESEGESSVTLVAEGRRVGLLVGRTVGSAVGLLVGLPVDGFGVRTVGSDEGGLVVGDCVGNVMVGDCVGNVDIALVTAPRARKVACIFA